MEEYIENILIQSIVTVGRNLGIGCNLSTLTYALKEET